MPKFVDNEPVVTLPPPSKPATAQLDPLQMAAVFWPEYRFYDKQVQIVYSVRDVPETYVVAGNQLGKDFIAGFICVWYLLSWPPSHTVRVVTTSIKDDHLRVLWGEINRFINTSAVPLHKKDGGPLMVNFRDVRRIKPNGEQCSISYLRGMVSEKGEGLAGHHADHTLVVGDEASGLDEQVYDQCQGWAKRKLFIGNPNVCQNFFFRNVRAGDLLATY